MRGRNSIPDGFREREQGGDGPVQLRNMDGKRATSQDTDDKPRRNERMSGGEGEFVADDRK